MTIIHEMYGNVKCVVSDDKKYLTYPIEYGIIIDNHTFRERVFAKSGDIFTTFTKTSHIVQTRHGQENAYYTDTAI